MKKRRDLHLLKLVFKASYSDAWPSYLKINEVVHTRLLRSKCCEKISYRIYSANRPERLLNFWTLRVGAYSRWVLTRGWAFIKFSPFSTSGVCLFCNKTINGSNKTRRCNKTRFL